MPGGGGIDNALLWAGAEGGSFRRIGPAVAVIGADGDEIAGDIERQEGLRREFMALEQLQRAGKGTAIDQRDGQVEPRVRPAGFDQVTGIELGKASCRESVCQYG